MDKPATGLEGPVRSKGDRNNEISIIQYIFALCVAAIAPFAVALLGQAIQAQQDDERDALAQSMQLATITARQIEIFIDGARHRLEYFSGRPAVIALDRNNCDYLIEGFHERNRGFNNLLTFDLSGNLICSSVRPTASTPRHVDPSFFINKVRETNAFAIGRATRGFVTNRWTVALAYPIRNVAGLPIGVIDAAVNLSELIPVVATSLPDDGTIAMVINADGVVLSQSRENDATVGRTFPSIEFMSNSTQQSKGTVWARGFDGIERLWGYTAVAGTNWYALVGMPAEIINQTLYRRLATDLTVIVAAMLLGGLAAYFISRRISRPLLSLTRTADRVRKGDLTVRAAESGPQEIAALARYFNHSLNQISTDIERRDHLATRLRKFERAVEQSMATIIITDLTGQIEYANPQFEKTTGYQVSEVIGKNSRILQSGDKSRADYKNMWLTILSGKSWVGEFTNRRKNGELYYEQATISPIYNDAGEITHFVAVKEDISRRRLAEQRRAESEALYRTLAESAPIGIFMHDGETISYANRAFAQMMRAVSIEQIFGSGPLDIFDHVARNEAAARLERLLSGSSVDPTEAVLVRLDESTFVAEIMEVPVRLNDQNIIQTIILDIDKRKRAEAKAEHLTQFDPLTDLPNRILFMDRIGQAIIQSDRRKKMVALLTIGLDHFKYINDLHGNDIGDKLLIDIARSINNELKGVESLARIGGDIFAILTKDLDHHDDVARLALNLNAMISGPRNINGIDLQVTASIGIALCPTDGTDPATLLRNADAAMHQAKKEGRARFSYYREEFNKNARDRLELQAAIWRGIRHGEFFMQYQPQYELRTGRLCGLEALIRWRTDEGIVPPSRFVPVAEETGQIVELGNYIIESVIAQAAAWKRAGLPIVPVGINVAAEQFGVANFCDHLREVLKSHNLEGGWIDLEITESSLMSGSEVLADKLAELRSVGASISVDDFGTGYSSLLYLKRFPINRIKIDQGFVRSLNNSKEDQALVRAIIMVGRALGMKTIAEGVETPEHRDFLIHEGCDEAQGYLFAKPLAAEEIEKLLMRSA